MKIARILASMILAVITIVTQFAVVLAAPPLDKAASIAGAVTKVTLETDSNTDVTTVLVTVMDQNGVTQTVRISEKAAAKLGLVVRDTPDGNLRIVTPLPAYIDIDAKTVISDDGERHHPVADALATFFSTTIDGLDYDVIMNAHADGNGFGVIAQALWLIKKMGGTADDFVTLLNAKKNNDFADFPLDDGTIPTSWTQLRTAVANQHLGLVMSQKNKDHEAGQGNANTTNPNSNKDKDKDRSNHGNEHSNGNDNGGNSNKP